MNHLCSIMENSSMEWSQTVEMGLVAGLYLVQRNWREVVQGGQLPVECRQLRGSEEHLQDRVPGSHLSDLLSIKIIEKRKKYDEKQTQGATSVSNVIQLVLRNLFFCQTTPYSQSSWPHLR